MGAEVMGCMPEPRSLVPSRDALLDLEGGNHTLLEHLRQLICGWGGGTFHLSASLYQNFLCKFQPKEEIYLSTFRT